MIMYFGGDAIDLAVMIVLCSQWFAATKDRKGAQLSARMGR
jgi:cytochrome c oxidase assembly factor CtaG